MGFWNIAWAAAVQGEGADDVVKEIKEAENCGTAVRMGRGEVQQASRCRKASVGKY